MPSFIALVAKRTHGADGRQKGVLAEFRPLSFVSLFLPSLCIIIFFRPQKASIWKED